MVAAVRRGLPLLHRVADKNAHTRHAVVGFGEVDRDLFEALSREEGGWLCGSSWRLTQRTMSRRATCPRDAPTGSGCPMNDAAESLLQMYLPLRVQARVVGRPRPADASP